MKLESLSQHFEKVIHICLYPSETLLVSVAGRNIIKPCLKRSGSYLFLGGISVGKALISFFTCFLGS